MEALIQQYGYLVVLVGTFLEGETVLVLAGFAAHRGYLQLPWVITAAFVGSLFGDQLFFYLGRRHSGFLLRHRPHWQPRIERAQELIQRYSTLIILIFRFLYGLRTVTPFALGMSKVPARLFVPLNAGGALIWAVAIGGAGYLFGNALELILGDVKRYEMVVLLALLAGGILIWAGHLWRRRLSARKPPE